MKKISEPIVFFGSGPVAAKSLELLLEDFDVELVITKPRASHHKGPVPVLELAEQRGIPVMTAASKAALDELVTENNFKSRLAVLIDFGIIVSGKVIDTFPLGIVNSHFSLLPQWRGADPITFSILSGQLQSGVSLMLLTPGMDEGPLLAQSAYDLREGITTPELTADLIELSNAALTAILPLYIEGETEPAPQEAVSISATTEPSYSRKLTKEDGVLDFTKPAEVLEREIRAFIDWPKSRARLGDIDVIITSAYACSDTSGKPGVVEVSKDPTELRIYCGAGYLNVNKLKPAGKKEMRAQEFIAGYRSRLTRKIR